MGTEIMTFDQVSSALQYNPPACQLCEFVHVTNPDDNDDVIKKTRRVLNGRREKGKSDLSCFEYFQAQMDIAYFTGKDLLRYLANIFRDDNLIAAGNCLLFEIDGKNELGLMIFERWCLSNCTSASENVQDWKLFAKLFDEKTCNILYGDENFQKRYLFSPENVQKCRDGLKQRFAAFLIQPLGNEQIPVAYRNAFMGVLLEIAKLQLQFNGGTPINKADNESTKVPVAACVMLAIDSGISEGLQSVFGEHNDNVTRIDGQFRHAYREENDQAATWEEVIENRVRARFRGRMEAARKIIDRKIRPTEEGLYRKVEVEKLVQEVNAFYDLSQSVSFFD